STKPDNRMCPRTRADSTAMEILQHRVPALWCAVLDGNYICLQRMLVAFRAGRRLQPRNVAQRLVILERESFPFRDEGIEFLQLNKRDCGLNVSQPIIESKVAKVRQVIRFALSVANIRTDLGAMISISINELCDVFVAGSHNPSLPASDRFSR